MFVTSYVVREWDRMNNEGIHRAVSECENELNTCRSGRSVGYWRHRDMAERAGFFLIKHQFLTKNKLMMDFDYVRYIEKSFVVWSVETVHISGIKWAAICVLIWVNWLRSFVMDIVRRDPFPGGKLPLRMHACSCIFRYGQYKC